MLPWVDTVSFITFVSLAGVEHWISFRSGTRRVRDIGWWIDGVGSIANILTDASSP